MGPAPRPAARVVCCPQCGSTRIRKPTRPLLFNVIVCVICLPLMFVICAMAFAAAISLLALPVTTGIAVLGRYRCRSCRHRFDREPPRAGHPALPSFPWRWHALNIVLLVLLCFVAPYIMQKQTGAGASAGRLADMEAAAGLFMTLAFFLWVSLIYHLILRSASRRKLRHPLTEAILLVLPGILVGTTAFYKSLPHVRAGALLRLADLAPLPESTTAIRVYSWSSPFSGEDFLRFTARPADLERFLSESPALQGQEPTRFSAERMRLPLPQPLPSTWDRSMDAHEYFAPRSHWPHWYKQEIRGPARKYIVQPPDYHYPGEILVDDETSTVYVRLCFS
jgi:hypothetical protein